MSCRLEKGFPLQCYCTAQPKQPRVGLSLDSGEAGCLRKSRQLKIKSTCCSMVTIMLKVPMGYRVPTP